MGRSSANQVLLMVPQLQTGSLHFPVWTWPLVRGNQDSITMRVPCIQERPLIADPDTGVHQLPGVHGHVCRTELGVGRLGVGRSWRVQGSSCGVEDLAREGITQGCPRA